jgi:archaemetzincin
MDKIILNVLSNVDNNLLEALKNRLGPAFGKKVEIRYDIHDLTYAYDPKRRQYVSPRVIARLRRIKKNPGDLILGITDVDLFAPDYEYVYGEAEMASGTATLSLFHLQSKRQKKQTNQYLLEKRVFREAVHELGHLYSLNHCSNPGCVMNTCPCVNDIDKAGQEFCEQCDGTLTRNLSEVLAIS